MEQQKTKMEPRFTFRIFIPVAVLYVIQYFSSLVVTEILMVYDMRHYTAGSFTTFIMDFMARVSTVEVNGVINTVYAVAATILFGWWYLKSETSRERIRHPFRDMTSNVPLLITGLVLVVIGLHYVAIYLMNSLAAMFPDMAAEYASLMESAGIEVGNISPAIIVYAVILGPICEELAFRGLTYKTAARTMPFVWANVVQALLFAAMHMNLIQSAYAFVMALVLGYIMYKFDSIILCIAVHILFNLTGSVLTTFFVAGGDTPVSFFAWFLGSMVVTYLGVMMLYKAAPVKAEEETKEEQ